MTERDTAVPQLYEMFIDLASVVCVTACLNVVNTELNGKGKLLYDIFSDVKACEEKLNLLCCCISKQNLSYSPPGRLFFNLPSHQVISRYRRASSLPSFISLRISICQSLFVFTREQVKSESICCGIEQLQCKCKWM
jgi:hypothetical protein